MYWCTGTVVAYAMNVIMKLVMFLYSYNNSSSIIQQVMDIVVDEDRNCIIDYPKCLFSSISINGFDVFVRYPGPILMG